MNGSLSQFRFVFASLLLLQLTSAFADFKDFGTPSNGKTTGIVVGTPISAERESRLRKDLPSPGDPGAVSTGVIHTRCLARWDDSHQLHSTELIVQVGYQAWKKTLKKLEHCIRLDLNGVRSIDGIAEQYLQQCTEAGLNDQKTRHAFELMLAIYADKSAEWKTDFTLLKVADYARSAANATVDCLLNTDKISEFLAERLRERYKATVKEESRWIYWEP